MRRLLALLPISLALALGAPGQAGAALTPTITSFQASAPVSPESGPYAIAAGSDGALWFTDPYAHRIGRMTVNGVLTLQAPVPPGSFQYDIAAGGDGAMWFVSQSPSRVNRIDAAGNVLFKDLAEPLANPTDIVSGPDGALWFTETVKKAIGRIPAATPLAVPDESRTTAEGPNGIASGPDGRIWFVEYSASKVGRMALDGSTTYFPLPPAIENPDAIAAGPDGALWVTTLNPAAIVRMTTEGVSLTHRLPVSPFPGEIATGSDGALWFTASDNIGRITTNGEIEIFPLPAGVGVLDIAPGPDGNLWFTQANAGMIGRITTPPTALTGASGPVGATSVTIAGSVGGHSQTTEARIEYGPPNTGMTRSEAVQLPASPADRPVSITIGGLQPSTGYRYRLTATNGTGSASGEIASFVTAQEPRCRVSRTKRRKAGKIDLGLDCTATTDSAVALATSRKRGKKFVYGTARTDVANGVAKLRIKPRKKALAKLRAGNRLRVKILVTAFGAGTSTTEKTKLLVRGRGTRH
jgi:virginiamycin B lyase